MTKSELIKKIQHNNELNFVEVEKIVNESNRDNKRLIRRW